MKNPFKKNKQAPRDIKTLEQLYAQELSAVANSEYNIYVHQKAKEEALERARQLSLEAADRKKLDAEVAKELKAKEGEKK